MSPQRPTHIFIGKLLLVTITLNGLFGFAPAMSTAHAQNKNRVIVINADQPNVWTLEQAHYLLAQMHRRNLDLRTKNLEELDPNEIAGLRFDVLRTLVELGVTFDDANRVSNRMVSRNQNFNTARREELTARRQKLRDESLGLTREIGSLQAAKAAATTQEEKDRLDGEIAAKTTVRAEVDKEVEFTDKELATITAPSGEFQRTEAQAEFDPDKLPKSIFDDAFKDAAETMIERFNQEPRLNASLRLDNVLQLQYEIIAKQLTLLRDEVGPGERLLFLELPQTVNATHHESDKKWAQSWWRIAGYTRNVEEYADALPEPLRDPYRARMRNQNRSQNRNQNTNQDTNQNTNQNQNRSQNQNQSRDDNQNENSNLNAEQERKANQDRQERRMRRRLEGDAPQPTSQKIEQLLDVLSSANLTRRVTEIGNIQYVNLDSEQDTTLHMNGRSVKLHDRTVRTVELIPRQSSLNVNDLKLRVKSGKLTAIASFLFGFGARLDVQRQREQFSQFVQQELYSAAFGKGSREFGWTFTPMPGTDRLHSGVRTTYAVVIVPEEATSLVLEANGCYFPRSAYQPNDFNDTINRERWGIKNKTSRNCGESNAFLVPIPVGGSGQNDFRVEGLTYRPVNKGQRIVVSVHGYNFSAQTGVLVNGSPLTHAIGLAQPLIRDDSLTGARTAEDLKGEKVRGRVERIDSEQIVFSFEMPPDYTDTPTITLVAPGKAIDLNRLTDLYINGVHNTSLAASAPMFNLDPPEPAIKIDGIEAYRSAGGRRLTVLANGKGFDPSTQDAYVNGVEVPEAGFVSPSLIRVEIPTPPDEIVQLVLSTGNKTIKSKAIINPAYLRITNVTVVSYEPPSRRLAVGVLVVKLEGSGLSEWLIPSIGRLTHLSSTEALLRIENPALVTPLVLTDRRTGFEARTTITLAPPQK
ncbi:MAG TPA: IPT/TIG domain-containing protein [Pyrinomonadaceae bacterium]